MGKFYYVTVASKDSFIGNFTVWAVKSLIKAGISLDDIHVVGNTHEDYTGLHKLLPQITNLYELNQDLSFVKWRGYAKKRKFSLVKAAALHKIFTKPIEDRCMVHFDGDVLWYKNPDPFFDTKCEKTWFHHGKDLAKRSKFKKEQIDIRNLKSLQRWASLPCAHLMVKHGATHLPDREVVAGLYMMHPRDHEAVLKLTYEGCVENADKFLEHEGAGDQKPMNAALSILNTDWHGGSKFFCPEFNEYGRHFMGVKEVKKIFHKQVKKMGLSK